MASPLSHSPSPISRINIPDAAPVEAKKASNLGQKAVDLLKAGVGHAIGLTGAAAMGVGGLVGGSSALILGLAAPGLLAQSGNALHHVQEGFHNISIGESMQQSTEIGKELDRGFNIGLLTATGMAVGGLLILSGGVLHKAGNKMAS